MSHENGSWMNEDQRDSHPEPFTFLDDLKQPIKAQRWGGEWWLFYWHESSKSWVSLRKVSGDDLRGFRKRAMSDADARFYDDLHAQSEAKACPVVSTPIAAQQSMPQTREEAKAINDGFKAGLTAYACVIGHSGLRSENAKLRELMDAHGFKTLDLFHTLPASDTEMLAQEVAELRRYIQLDDDICRHRENACVLNDYDARWNERDRLGKKLRIK